MIAIVCNCYHNFADHNAEWADRDSAGQSKVDSDWSISFGLDSAGQCVVDRSIDIDLLVNVVLIIVLALVLILLVKMRLIVVLALVLILLVSVVLIVVLTLILLVNVVLVNNGHSIGHSWASLLLKVTSVKR